MTENKTSKPVIWAIIAGAALLSVYFLILSLANSFSHAVEQFKELWYWIVLLVLGFGLQVGLYTYIRGRLRMKAAAATTSVAAAGGVSTTSMVACCAHHLADVLPLIGLSAAAVFLNRFQTLFILLGVLSNIVGITMMLRLIQRHKLYGVKGILPALMSVDMNKAFYTSIGLSLAVFTITLVRSL